MELIGMCLKPSDTFTVRFTFHSQITVGFTFHSQIKLQFLHWQTYCAANVHWIITVCSISDLQCLVKSWKITQKSGSAGAFTSQAIHYFHRKKQKPKCCQIPDLWFYSSAEMISTHAQNTNLTPRKITEPTHIWSPYTRRTKPQAPVKFAKPHTVSQPWTDLQVKVSPQSSPSPECAQEVVSNLRLSRERGKKKVKACSDLPKGKSIYAGERATDHKRQPFGCLGRADTYIPSSLFLPDSGRTLADWLWDRQR